LANPIKKAGTDKMKDPYPSTSIQWASGNPQLVEEISRRRHEHSHSNYARLAIKQSTDPGCSLAAASAPKAAVCTASRPDSTSTSFPAAWRLRLVIRNLEHAAEVEENVRAHSTRDVIVAANYAGAT
jgi:hypothetical protein